VRSDDLSIHYAWSGSDDVAWSDAGKGSPVLLGGWWMSHLERDWEYEPFRAFVAAIARHRRVIRMDPPGSGLSRTRETPADLDAHVTAMLAVLDAAEVPEATLFAGSSGCPVAIAFAARHPDRVRRLVFSGPYLAGSAIAPAPDRAALVELVRRSWGVSSRVMSDIFYPDATPDERRAYIRHQRSTATADAAAAALEAVYSFDARGLAADVAAPAIVLHRRGDRAIRLSLGAAVAEALPHAHLKVLDGAAHHPWHGDSGALLAAALRFDGVLDSELGSPQLAQPRTPPGSPITPREYQVLLLVARGSTDAQIAAELFLSVHTVHRHVANARTKLGVASRAAAAAWAVAQTGGVVPRS
jgi:pimeloyl-ACP methyl ester carboxylesterase/DNA-binding CsgD family transcriptional regulator